MAQEHALFANCLTCGQILCTLDRGETCPFCGDDPLKAPDMDALMKKITTAVDGGQRSPLGLEGAQKRAARLVAVDSQGASAAVLEEAPDQATADFFQYPSYASWETIQEAKDRYARAREAAESEKASHRQLQLSSLLGLM